MKERLRGKFIVFEGIDGSGKSTQAEMLASVLREKGKNVLLEHEPTEGTYGRQIRDSFKTERLPLDKELELFTLDRQEHLREQMLPHLRKGGVVILDRYYFSTAAYQGARGLSVEGIIRTQEAFAYAPDLLALIDVPVDTALARIAASRKDGANTFEEREYLENVREIFLSLSHPTLHVFDGTKDAEALHEEIVDLLFE